MSNAPDIRITDLANPVLSDLERQAQESAQPVELSEDAVLQAAMDETGLSDFGADDFRERLHVWLQGLNEDTGLGPLGRAMASDKWCATPPIDLRIEDLIRSDIRKSSKVELRRPISSPVAALGHHAPRELLATHPDLRSMQLWEIQWSRCRKPDEMNWESDGCQPALQAQQRGMACLDTT